MDSCAHEAADPARGGPAPRRPGAAAALVAGCDDGGDAHSPSKPTTQPAPARGGGPRRGRVGAAATAQSGWGP